MKVPKKPGRKGKAIKAGPRLFAYLIVAKYADHLPLYRLEGIFKCHGYKIARSTLCDWLKHATKILDQIYGGWAFA
ncbi:MAG: transposase [Gammaproteobacteria bacterium]